jgi:hypothetical protein
MQSIASNQSSAEVPINENFAGVQHQECYAKKPTTSNGLVWGYWGGRWGGFSVADGTFTLTNATDNYIVAKRSDGVTSASTATTNWNNLLEYARVYKVTTAGSVVTATEDHRAGLGGVHGSPDYGGSVIVSVSAARTFALTDQGRKTFLHPSADTTARTWTIDANATVALPVGTELEIVNQASAGVLTLAITTDTMRLSPGGTTGSRTLAANGWARIKKITSTEWIIAGDGLT